jgi:hypothetical protein
MPLSTSSAKPHRAGTRRLTLFHASSFLVLMAAMAAPVAWSQEPSFIDTVRRSGFIFVGTVKTVGAGVNVPIGPRFGQAEP